MRAVRTAMVMVIIALIVSLSHATGALAAPYAAIVIDARTGEVLHSRSADRRLHPASLTKMMTLYMTFEAVKDGRLKLDQKVSVSRHAARQVPSKIGLRAGQQVTIRHLIRAAAVKSANDAAVALAEAQAGTEAEFAKRMTVRARQLGMSSTTFRNASGLTAKGHRSTARDMALLGRALFYDFPEYYNLFGRVKTHALGRTIYNTNRRLLRGYRGADGIKTGYTNAAGYNLVSSAERRDKRIIAVVFGGKSSRWRNARVAKLLDMGFDRAPAHAAVTRLASRIVTLSPPPRPRPGETPTLLAKAGREIGEALVPAAQAAVIPIEMSPQVPETSPAPRARALPRMAAVAPRPRPATETAAVVPPPRPAQAEGWVVQLGVFGNEATAIAELASARLSEVKGVEMADGAVRRTELSGKSAWRVQLTGLGGSDAKRLCSALKSSGRDCLAIAPKAN